MKKTSIWQIIIPSVLMMLMMGTVYAWSVFRPHVEASFNVGVAQSGYPYMVSLFFYALWMMIGGRLLGRFKARTLALSGAVLIGLGWVLSALSTSFVVFVLAYGVLIGSGVGMVYGVPIALIQTSHLPKQGLYTGIVLSGFGMSPLIGAPVVLALLSHYDLRTAMLILGVVFLMGLLICVLLLPAQTQQSTVSTSNQGSLNRRGLFVVIYVLFTMATAIGLMMIGLSYNVGLDYYAFDPRIITALVALFAVLNGLAR